MVLDHVVEGRCKRGWCHLWRSVSHEASKMEDWLDSRFRRLRIQELRHLVLRVGAFSVGDMDARIRTTIVMEDVGADLLF